ncbi:hypothetical protein AK830_g7161 [Neonectria ditissima]|uniref:FAD-binding FR-type domain-containing protein n=1 Tax=Neonectria ditissima TaxID=78410 RepID=A0A0P7BFR5_9HYPO|nr:hypothetical protein AK830_g7161 [Neonectria ditissima]
MSWGMQLRQARPAPIIASLAAGGIGFGIMAKLIMGNASAESNAPTKVFKGGPAFVSLPLESSEAVNHNTKRLRFKLPQNDAISGLTLTSAALLTVSWPKGSWLPVPRPYTPVSASGHSPEPDDKTAITLVFGVNSDADVLLRKEFEQFSAEFPDRFKAVYTVSHPIEGSPFRKGYVTKELLEAVTPSPIQNTKVFVCGPPAMEESLVGKKRSPGVLEQPGYKKNQIHRF